MTVIVHRCHPSSITVYERISGFLLGGSKDHMPPTIMQQPEPGAIGADHYAFEAYKSVVLSSDSDTSHGRNVLAAGNGTVKSWLRG